jgi:hypothetical protein
MAAVVTKHSDIYTGSTDGELWMSTSAGDTWRRIDEGLPNGAVNSIAVHPRNPNDLRRRHLEPFGHVKSRVPLHRHVLSASVGRDRAARRPKTHLGGRHQPWASLRGSAAVARRRCHRFRLLPLLHKRRRLQLVRLAGRAPELADLGAQGGAGAPVSLRRNVRARHLAHPDLIRPVGNGSITTSPRILPRNGRPSGVGRKRRRACFRRPDRAATRKRHATSSVSAQEVDSGKRRCNSRRQQPGSRIVLGTARCVAAAVSPYETGKLGGAWEPFAVPRGGRSVIRTERVAPAALRPLPPKFSLTVTPAFRTSGKT